MQFLAAKTQLNKSLSLSVRVSACLWPAKAYSAVNGALPPYVKVSSWNFVDMQFLAAKTQLNKSLSLSVRVSACLWPAKTYFSVNGALPPYVKV